MSILDSLWSRLRGDRPSEETPGDGPPVLEWVMRANSGLGAWLVAQGTKETALASQGVDSDLDMLVRMRLEQHRTGDSQGVERLERGILVYASLDGRAAGILLPSDASPGRRDIARHDLARLLDYDRWRPVLTEVAKQQDRPDETEESIALRLAINIERTLGVEAVVAIRRPTGVEVAGVSQRSDRRLRGTLVEAGSPLARVAAGASEALAGVEDPFGGAVDDRRARWGSTFVAPIPWNGPRTGAIAVWTPSGGEPKGEALAKFRTALDAAGPRLAAAIERRALQDRAVRDPLTGILNRRGLDERLRSIALGPGALVYADLDHFKKLNDALGHPAGDQALVHFTRLMLSAVRDVDLVARIGGEEFALWLPGASLERGRQVAERLRQGLAFSEWTWQGQRWRMTASFGVAACPETAPRVELLPEQADRALYVAKGQGRDRVSVAEQ